MRARPCGPMRIDIILFDGFDELDAIGPFEVLRNAEGLGGDLLPALVARARDRGTAVGSVCTGAMILAAAGLVQGRPATTHHSAIEDLRGAGATIVDGARVVDDGDLITAGGVTSGLDLALWLV